MMSCLHCSKTPGNVYTYTHGHHSFCYHCGNALGARDSRIKYLGITQKDDNFVHMYEHVHPFKCGKCGELFTHVFFHCDDDGGIIDLSEALKLGMMGEFE